MVTCTCAHVNLCIPNHWAELRQSVISDQSPSYGLGVNGVEAVNSRHMAVCRPVDCSCIGRTPNINRLIFYIQNFSCLVVYIIFHTYVTMSYVVFSSQKRQFPAPDLYLTLTQVWLWHANLSLWT